jgi:hypothetical protein
MLGAAMKETRKKGAFKVDRWGRCCVYFTFWKQALGTWTALGVVFRLLIPSAWGASGVYGLHGISADERLGTVILSWSLHLVCHGAEPSCHSASRPHKAPFQQDLNSKLTRYYSPEGQRGHLECTPGS